MPTRSPAAYRDVEALPATTFQESATIGGNLPETIDNETYVYEYRVCLEGGGRFLNARLTYTLP